MTIAMIKALLDACYQAKRIRDLLPPLPKGVTPAYIHYLDVIDQLERQGVRVRASDIGDTLDIPRPGVTRTVKEMEAKGYLRKTASEEDGRVTYITATEAGKLLSQRYNEHYFSLLAPQLADISDEDAACTVRTIERMHCVMSERRGRIDE